MIPAAAVEVAAKVLWDKELYAPWSSVSDGFKAPYLRDARQALEAAAPHMEPNLLEEWAVQFGSGGLEEAEDKADAEQKLADIRESVQNGMDSPDLEPMAVVRRYRIFETELTEWKVTK